MRPVDAEAAAKTLPADPRPGPPATAWRHPAPRRGGTATSRTARSTATAPPPASTPCTSRRLARPTATCRGASSTSGPTPWPTTSWRCRRAGGHHAGGHGRPVALRARRRPGGQGHGWGPVDEPLRWMLADPRRMFTKGMHDFLWVRLLDIPAAMAARRYQVEDSLVVEVADGFRPRHRRPLPHRGRSRRRGLRPHHRRARPVARRHRPRRALPRRHHATQLAQAQRGAELTPGARRRADAFFATSSCRRIAAPTSEPSPSPRRARP